MWKLEQVDSPRGFEGRTAEINFRITRRQVQENGSQLVLFFFHSGAAQSLATSEPRMAGRRSCRCIVGAAQGAVSPVGMTVANLGTQARDEFRSYSFLKLAAKCAVRLS